MNKETTYSAAIQEIEEILGKIELTLQAREIIEKGLSSSDIASLRKLGETH